MDDIPLITFEPDDEDVPVVRKDEPISKTGHRARASVIVNTQCTNSQLDAPCSEMQVDGPEFTNGRDNQGNDTPPESAGPACDLNNFEDFLNGQFHFGIVEAEDKECVAAVSQKPASVTMAEVTGASTSVVLVKEVDKSGIESDTDCDDDGDSIETEDMSQEEESQEPMSQDEEEDEEVAEKACIGHDKVPMDLNNLNPELYEDLGQFYRIKEHLYCPFCNLFFDDKSKWRIHGECYFLRVQSELLNKGEDPRTFVDADGKWTKLECDVCGHMTKYGSNSFENHRTHMIQHFTPTLVCKICANRVVHKNNMRRHILSHGQKYPCPNCKWVFNSQAMLNKHMLDHSGELILFHNLNLRIPTNNIPLFTL